MLQDRPIPTVCGACKPLSDCLGWYKYVLNVCTTQQWFNGHLFHGRLRSVVLPTLSFV